MSIDFAPDAPAMKPEMRHDDPRFQEEFAQRSAVTITPLNGEVTLTATPDVFDQNSAESNGNGEQTNGKERPARRTVLDSAVRITRRIFDAVQRNHESLTPPKKATHTQRDRHGELGTIMRMANNGSSPATLISIMLQSRYPITRRLAIDLIGETKVQPGVVVSEYERPDEDMEAYLDLLEQLGYD